MMIAKSLVLGALVALLCGTVAVQAVRVSSLDEAKALMQTRKRLPHGTGGYVPVYVMLPLDLLVDNTVNDPSQLLAWFQQCAAAKVDGVMTDMWWGIVEEAGPQQYNWTGYMEVVNMAQSVGLKMQAIMSFHQCGGNAGDNCNVPLPPWVLSVGESNPDIFYTDQQGNRDQEYLSLGVDNEALFSGRTPIQIYRDYMESFAETFAKYLPSVIVTVEISMGPAGEMRYPSYQLDKWTFPGIGEFQCYDKYMLASLGAAATAAGHSDWGYAGPDNAGTYDSTPSETGFFSDDGGDNWSSPYGDFFLSWYSGLLLAHGDAILSQAEAVFAPIGVRISAKIAGIHWWYLTNSHAAENTAGYYNTINNNGYNAIAQLCGKYNALFDYTAVELMDNQNSGCECGPQELVSQTEVSAQTYGAGYMGENALTLFDQAGYQEVEFQATQHGLFHAFTYLRMGSDLMDNSANWQTFTTFVQNMHTLI